MVKRSAKLRSVLARRQGRDLVKEKQTKVRKEAEKRKRRRVEQSEDNEETGILGVATQPEDDEPLLDHNGASASEDENSDDDELNNQHENLSKLVQSESDTSEDDDSGDEGQDGTTPQQSSKRGPKTLQEQLAFLAQADDTTDTQQKDAEGDRLEDGDSEDVQSQASSIPLSDVASNSREETENDIIPHQRLTINNTAALKKSLQTFALPTDKLPFSEHQSITTHEPVSIDDIDDDLNRELAFYKQCLSSVKEARALLNKEGVPFTRPTDYFAEMVKSDEHMGRIKDKLMSDAASKRAAQEARKQRDLRKFGKLVQQEKLKDRAKAKREMLEKVNVLKRKRQGAGLDRDKEEDMFDVALEDAAETERNDREDRKTRSNMARNRGTTGQANAKRQKKDSKFGFGGKKRFNKSNDARSSSDVSGFSVKKMKGKPTKQRPGKSRRAKV